MNKQDIKNSDWLEKLKASVKNAYHRFVKIRGNPKEIALGFALGIFVGMSPYMGFHMAIAVFFASVLKWNKISAATAVWISNPLTAPIIYPATYYMGSKIITLKICYSFPRHFNLDALIVIIKQTPEIFLTLTVGGVVLGIPLAVVGYYLSLAAIVKYRKGLAIAKEKEFLAKTKEKLANTIKRKQ